MSVAIDAIAAEVVIRHICHCEGSTETPETHALTEHVFMVDGKDFPWYISERGPTVTRVDDELYTVDVDVILTDKETHQFLSFGYTGPNSSVPYIPVINGSPFPWLCNDAGYTLTFGSKELPLLRVAFYAHNVDARGIDIQES